MGDLDIAAKALLRIEPGALLALALRGARIRAIQAEETELPAQALLMDKLFRIELDGVAEPRWQHFEVEAVWSSSVPREAFFYWSRGSQRFTPLRSFVLVLKRGDRQGAPRGEYVVDDGGDRLLTFRFDVLCAWELDAEELLRRGDPGLLPLVPFAGGSSVERVEQALRQMDHLEPAPRRAELLAALAAFAGNVYPDVDWIGKIPREILMESTVYRDIKAEGRAEGEAVGERKLLAFLLRERLGVQADTLTARLEAATADQLNEAARAVLRTGDAKALASLLDRLLPAAAPRA